LSKRLNFAFSGLALAWIIFGYYRYLSSPDWEALTEILAQFEVFEAFIVTSGIFDLVIVLGVWAASDFLGVWFLSTVGVRPNAGTERLVLSSAAGLALLSLAVTILGVANLLNQAAGWTLVGVPAAFWLLRRRRASVEAHSGPDEPWRISTSSSGDTVTST
jgi:hypothetical protein